MNNSDRTSRKSTDKEANAMASNDIEVLDPAATVEKHKETESGVALDRRHFLTALGVAGAAASVMAGADLLSSGPKAFAQFQPPIGGYKQLDVMNFLMNIKYLKATLYAFLTTGADIPNYPTYVTFGSGQIYNQPGKITTFPTQQITDLFNEMYYDELNQLVDLRNLIGNVTGDVVVVSRPTMDMLGTGNKATATTTMTFQQALGYARMLEDLSVQVFAGATAYLTGANLAYVSQILATNGYHAGAVRLICIQNNIPYIGTGFLTTTAAGAQTLNTFSGVLVTGSPSFYLPIPTNAPIIGSVISGIGVPQSTVITAYAPAANTTFTAVTNSATNAAVLTGVSSVAGLVQYQPVAGTYIPAGAYILPGGVGTNTVTLSANTTNTTAVAPTGYTSNGSNTITGVSSVSGILAGEPISGTGIPASATVVSASGTNIVITPTTAATATSQVTLSGLLTAGSTSITSVSTTSGLIVGQPITATSGAALPSGTTISAIGNAITMSNKATATTTQTVMTTTGTLTNGSAVITGVPSAGFTNLANGQPFGVSFTGTATLGSTSVTSVSSTAGLAVGDTVAGTSVVGTTITTVIAGTITSISGTTVVLSSAATLSATGAALIATPPGIAPGATITGFSQSTGTITMSSVANNGALSPAGTLTAGSNVITGLSSLTGIAVGQPIAAVGTSIGQVTIPAGALVGSINANTSAITLSPAAAVVNPFPTGIVTSGSTSVTSVSSPTGLAVGQTIYGNFIPAGTTITAISGSTLTLSASASGSSGTAETLIVVAAITATVTSGSTSLTSVSPTTSLAVGQTISGNNIVPGTIIVAISGSTVNTANPASFTFNGTVAAGTNTVTALANTTAPAIGQTIAGANIQSATTISSVNLTAGTLTMSKAATGTSGPLLESLTVTAGGVSDPSAMIGAVTGGSNIVTGLSFTAGLAVGQLIVGNNLPAGTYIAGVDGTVNTVTLSNLVSGANTSPTAEPLTIYSGTISAPSAIIGAVTGGSSTVTSLTTATFVPVPEVAGAGLAVGQAIAGPNIPTGTIITSVNSTTGTLTMSNAATGTSGPLLETLTITGISITVPLTPLTNTAAAYYGAFAGVTGGGTTLPGITTVGNNVVSAIPPLTGLAIGQPIFGNYIPAGSTVTIIGAGAASPTNPGVGTVTMSNPAVGSSFNTEDIVIGIPTAALLTIGVITPLVPLTATTTQTFTSPTTVALKIPSAVTVTVSKGIMTLSAAVTVTGTQTLTMVTGDIMDVEPFDLGTAAAAALGPAAVTIPSSTYSTQGPTNPTVYQGFFNTASGFVSTTSPGTATANTPAGFVFARSFGQSLSALLGSTQFNPPTYQGGFFPVGVSGPINVNTDQ
jgi:hypothetical protein